MSKTNETETSETIRALLVGATVQAARASATQPDKAGDFVYWKQYKRERDALQAQRDDLLAALNKIATYRRCVPDALRKVARAAIAHATEGGQEQ